MILEFLMISLKKNFQNNKLFFISDFTENCLQILNLNVFLTEVYRPKS